MTSTERTCIRRLVSWPSAAIAAASPAGAAPTVTGPSPFSKRNSVGARAAFAKPTWKRKAFVVEERNE